MTQNFTYLYQVYLYSVTAATQAVDRPLTVKELRAIAGQAIAHTRASKLNVGDPRDDDGLKTKLVQAFMAAVHEAAAENNPFGRESHN